MKKKVAVLHAQVPFVYGGAEIHINNLVENLRLRGYDAELISMPFKWYPVHELLNSALLWRLADLSEANGQKIDLVIGTRYPTYVVEHQNKILWLLHQHRVAYDLYENYEWAGLKHIEGGPEARNKLREIDNRAIKECKRIYTNSQNVANRLKKYNGINGEKLYHPPLLVGRYKCESYGDYILSVGRLDKIKRVDLIIEAMKYTDNKLKLKIAGTGPEMESLKKFAAKLGLESRVEFLGFVSNEDLLELYANALAVAYPPADEDYGYVTLESFLSYKPVLTTEDSGGPLEFVEHGINGLVSETNPEAFGENIMLLYKNRNKCREFGEIGYKKVKDITWDNVIDKLTQTLR